MDHSRQTTVSSTASAIAQSISDNDPLLLSLLKASSLPFSVPDIAQPCPRTQKYIQYLEKKHELVTLILLKDKVYNPIAILKRLTTVQPIRRQYWLLSNEDLSLYLQHHPSLLSVREPKGSTPASPLLTPQLTIERQATSLHSLPPIMSLRPSLDSSRGPDDSTKPSEEPLEPKKRSRLKQVVETMMNKKREDEEDEESSDEEKKEEEESKKFRNFDAVYSMTKERLKSLRSKSPKRPTVDEMDNAVRRDSEESDGRRELEDSSEERPETPELKVESLKQDQELLKRRRDRISQLLDQWNHQSTTFTLLSQSFESIPILIYRPTIPSDTTGDMKDRLEGFESMRQELTVMNEKLEKDLLSIHTEADRLAELISVHFGQRLKGIEDQFYELEKKQESAWLEVFYVLLDYVLRMVGFLIWIYYSVMRLFGKQRVPSRRTQSGAAKKEHS